MHYKLRTYRCEWVARQYWVDQYGQQMRDESVIWESAWPTRDEAVAALRDKFQWNERLLRWDVGHSYQSADVFYREVLVLEETNGV